MITGVPIDPGTLALVWAAMCSLGLGATVLMLVVAWWCR
jgi:hypothetical protein